MSVPWLGYQLDRTARVQLSELCPALEQTPSALAALCDIATHHFPDARVVEILDAGGMIARIHVKD